ncbi:MAG: DEAD/DEAH box helicase family protein [Candidatus Anstonellaceae archaeon]
MKKNISPKNQPLLPFEEETSKRIFGFSAKVLQEPIIKYFPILHFKPNLSLEQREYQERCISEILIQNPIKSNLIIFPAGTGKTYIAARICDYMLKKGKILVLSHRVSLSYQLANVFKKYFNLEEKEIQCLASATASKRKNAYNEAKIIISTPQGIANDLKKGSLKWNFSFIVFDEVDLGVGDYQYVDIAKKAKENNTPVLGLSATVGDKEKLKNLVQVFGFEKAFIKLDKDQDILPYRKKLIISQNILELEEPYQKMLQIIEDLMFSYFLELENYSIKINLPKEKCLTLQALKEIEDEINFYSKTNPKVLTFYAALLHLYDLKRIILEESREQIKQKFIFLAKEKEKGKKYPSKIFEDILQTEFKNYFKKAKTSKKLTLFLTHANNAKEYSLKNHTPLKAIAVVNSREFAYFIANKLKENGIKASVYLGKTEGFSKKNQLKALDDFLNSDLEFLVSTKNAIERGIDLPNAESIFILNPTSSDKSYIQLINRINRGFSPIPAKIIIYSGSLDEKIKNKISFFKTNKYYQFLEKLRFAIESEMEKPKDKQKSFLEIIDNTNI